MFRGRATANHLAQAGWDVSVVTAPREFFDHYLNGASDTTLDATVNPRLRVVRPGINGYHWETDLRQFRAWRANFPMVSQRLSRLIQSKVFPERYTGWVPGMMRASLAMHARRRFDLVLATGNPFVSFAAAWTLGRALRIPYVVDYRDSWTFNQFTEELLDDEDSVLMRWEARVLRDAAQIVFVNDVMLRWHAQRYPAAADRMRVVRNGWDPDTLGDIPYQPADPSRPPRFGYLGTITQALPLDLVFEAWRRARKHPLMAGAEFNIYGHLGFFPQGVEMLRQRLADEEPYGVRYHGPFGKTEAAKAYAETDALIFCPGGTRYVTSAKVFEYMATGKPIVSIHTPGMAAEEVLDGYPLWFSGHSLDPDTVADSIVAAAKAARDADPDSHSRALEHARRFSREAAMQEWEPALRQLVKKAR